MELGMKVRVVADSVNPAGARITTMLLKYQRFIHSEVMTHRAFSRNAASSRAIPVKKIIDSVKLDPALPVYWGKTQAGMQAAEECDPETIAKCKETWLASRDEAVVRAEQLLGLGLHKQIANRILEPWMHMQTLVTATELGNFFNLRVHKDAQPEFQALAKEMLVQFLASTPKQLKEGEWHLPFGDIDIPAETPIETRLKLVTARAARTSYKNFDGKSDVEADCQLHDRLAQSGHFSPFEHAARATSDPRHLVSGNFIGGWIQYRKLLQNENRTKMDPNKLLEALK